MIHEIKLNNFRKFKEVNFNTLAPIVIFSGPNATGKTSILESIYLISTSKSHRTNETENLILEKENFSKIEITTNKQYKMMISKEGKKNFINNVEYLKISDFIGNLKVVMFSPQDLELIQGSKGVRRRFLDLNISLLDRMYLKNLTSFKQILKERNEILKNYQNEDNIILNVITKQLIESIKFITNKRIIFIEELNKELNLICKELECENIILNYKYNYDLNDLSNVFNNKLNLDILTKTTNIGPHRDDVKILIDNLEANNYASEGQKRTIILAIKLAIKNLMVKYFKEEPILLLDDIFAALDQKRINQIMKYIKNTNQTFITTTSIFNIPDELLKNAKVIRL